MSRATVHDNSNAVSLFPFLAVLLCTMGALIVVLVCVTRMSREQALQELAAQEQAAAKPAAPDPDAEEARRKLEAATAYLAKLRDVRKQVEQQLKDDRSRLSHLEDHIRRQQEKLDELRMAAAELHAMQAEHFDDRVQAQRELKRLEQLIDASQKSIEELREEAKSRPRAYAIVPYKGPNGTDRRPIYIECRSDEVVLQPEGIRLTEKDFRLPLGPGNPLASALRAAREHVRREALAAGGAESPDPYPLILVRPDGIVAYYRVREAIESWDADFGYEFVDGDWDLKFPPANPQLAAIEFQAVETARARMKVLAAAAPRAYGTYQSSRGSFSLDEEFMGGSGADDGFGGDRYGGGEGTADSSYAIDEMASGGPGGEARGERPLSAADGHAGDGTGIGMGDEGGGSDRESTDASHKGVADVSLRLSDRVGRGGGGATSSPSTGSAQSRERQSNLTADGSIEGQSAAGSANSDAAAGADAANNSATASSTAGGSSSQQLGAPPNDSQQPSRVMTNVANQLPNDRSANSKPTTTRGKDWAIRNPDPGAVPIRRTILVIVRGDRLAIMPESEGAAAPATNGHEILLTGPTDQLADEIVTALERHIDQWGIAGRGLYWRPVLELTVGPDGATRANDLARLLKGSGLELQTAPVAGQPNGEAARANR